MSPLSPHPGAAGSQPGLCFGSLSLGGGECWGAGEICPPSFCYLSRYLLAVTWAGGMICERKARVPNLYFIFTSAAVVCLIMDSRSPLSGETDAVGRGRERPVVQAGAGALGTAGSPCPLQELCVPTGGQAAPTPQPGCLASSSPPGAQGRLPSPLKPHAPSPELPTPAVDTSCSLPAIASRREEARRLVARCPSPQHPAGAATPHPPPAPAGSAACGCRRGHWGWTPRPPPPAALQLQGLGHLPPGPALTGVGSPEEHLRVQWVQAGAQALVEGSEPRHAPTLEVQAP